MGPPPAQGFEKSEGTIHGFLIKMLSNTGVFNLFWFWGEGFQLKSA